MQCSMSSVCIRVLKRFLFWFLKGKLSEASDFASLPPSSLLLSVSLLWLRENKTQLEIKPNF